MRHYPFFRLLLLLFLVLTWEGGVAPVLATSGEVQIEKVEVQFSQRNPVVLLAVGDKTISIFVDPTVAGSIQGALTGEKFPRPLSHDLMQSILKTYDVRVDRVFITLREGVFYGTLTLSQNGRQQLFDSRSSDAIALAVHFHSPIFVERDLLDSAGKAMGLGKETKKDVEL
jgi:bifunctional DNase/RNase